MWRDVKVVGVGNVVRVFFARTLVQGDDDLHCSGLGTREADGGVIVIEVRVSALFECMGGWIDDVHVYVKLAEEVTADSPGGRCDYQEEEKIALVVVVLVVVELLLNGGIIRAPLTRGVRAPRCVPGLYMSHGIRGDRSRRR